MLRPPLGLVLVVLLTCFAITIIAQPIPSEPMNTHEQIQPIVNNSCPRFEALEPRMLLSGVTFPDGLSGVVNVVTQGIVPDDGIDDTAAINALLAAVGNNARTTVYFPDGVYDVRDTLEPSNAGFNIVKRISIQGQSELNTVFRLTPGSMNDPAQQTPVWDFAQDTNVAQAFHNFMQDLTIEVAEDNDGAIGLKFNANNTGAVRNVTIRETSGTGAIGMDLRVPENGPLFVQGLTLEGFEKGVTTSDHINSQTFENLTLNNQRTVGFQNGVDGGGRQAVTIAGLTSNNGVTVFDARREDPDPATVIVGASLTGQAGSETQIAINTGGRSYLRDIDVQGFAKAYEQKWDNPTLSGLSGNNLESAAYGFGQSQGFASLFPTELTGLNLPILPTPTVSGENSTTEWTEAVNVSGDDTASIQAAIDTLGVKTVVLDAPGTGEDNDWTLDETLVIRGDVERLVALGGRLTGDGEIRIDTGSAETVRIERLYQAFGDQIELVHNTARTLVVADSGFATYRNTTAGTGDVYLEDVVLNQALITQQRAWLKQINLENSGDEMGIGAYLVNDGGVVSILGLKTEFRGEDAYTFVHTLNGGRTELLGGVNHYNSGTWAADMPAYRVTDASFGMATPKRFDPGPLNSPAILLTESRDGVERTLLRTQKQSYSISRVDVLPGDFNGSGSVEQGDLNLVLNNWGRNVMTAGLPVGWIGGLPQGLVDQYELNTVLNNWGASEVPTSDVNVRSEAITQSGTRRESAAAVQPPVRETKRRSSRLPAVRSDRGDRTDRLQRPHPLSSFTSASHASVSPTQQPEIRPSRQTKASVATSLPISRSILWADVGRQAQVYRLTGPLQLSLMMR